LASNFSGNLLAEESNSDSLSYNPPYNPPNSKGIYRLSDRGKEVCGSAPGVMTPVV
jgi:hypothetical protein